MTMKQNTHLDGINQEIQPKTNDCEGRNRCTQRSWKHVDNP